MAAVVEPVGRKAKWSVNWRAGGGDSNIILLLERTLCQGDFKVKH